MIASGPTLQDWLDRLDRAGAEMRERNGEWRGRCPVHGGDRPDTLSVKQGRDRVLVRCFRGCTFEEIRAHLFGDAPPVQRQRIAPRVDRRTVGRTTYRIPLNGTELLHRRLDFADGSKTFLWGHVDRAGREREKLPEGVSTRDVPLYRVDEAQERPDAPVVLVEGEKSCDALWARGVVSVATTCGSSTTPSDAVLEALRGRDVIVWPDADEPGRKHGEALCKAMDGIARSLRVVDWKDAPPKGDAADFQGTDEELGALLDAARPCSTPSALPEPWTVAEIEAKAGEGVAWLVDGYLMKGGLTMLSSKSGVGKSTLVCHLLRCLETGTPFLGREVPGRVSALLLTEEGASTLWEKLRAFSVDTVRVYTREHLGHGMSWGELVHAVADKAREIGAALLIVDPFATWARNPGDSEQSSGFMTEAMAALLAVAGAGLTILILHHDTKAGNPFRGSGAIEGALDLGLWLKPADFGEENDRVLRVEKSRPAGKPPEVVIRMQDGRFEVLGSQHELKIQAAKAAILEALEDAEPDGLSASAVARDLGLRKAVVGGVLKAVARRTGSGPRTRWHPR